jgi:hypothetical protein
MSILPASAAPAIELSPDQGPTGSAVNIEGSGFIASSTVTLTFDKQSIPTVPETIVVDALGKFEAAFKVPDSADEGENRVVATAEIVLDNDDDGEEHDDDEDEEKRHHGDKKRDHDDKDEKDKERDDDEKDHDDDEDDGKGRDHDDGPRDFLRHKASATFTVIVDANSAPEAQSLSVATREERSVSIVLEGSDDDDDQISFSIVDDPQHGELHDFSSSAGTVIYQPSPDYHGNDSFSFKVNDGKEDSDSAEVTITVKSSTSHSSSGGGGSFPIPDEPDETNVDTSDDEYAVLTEATDRPVSNGISQYITDFIKTSQATSTGTNPFLTIATVTRTAGTADSQAPRLILPVSPLEVEAMSQSGARVNYNASALDDFDGELAPYCSPGSGYEFPVGTVNVVCKATDSAGNTALASFVVAVKQGAPEESPSVLLPFLIMGVVGAASFGGFWAVTRARTE